MALGTTEEAGIKAKSIINAMYKGYLRRSVVVQYLTMPHVRHVCMLLPLVRAHVRHAHLCLHIAVSLKGRTNCIWSFSYGFSYATAMGYARFRLLCYTIIIL